MPGQHAVLAPSSASRWLACTPSARLEQTMPDRRSDAADEGTVAHALGELLIRYKLKQLTKAAYNRQLAKIEESRFYNEAMYEHCENYAVYVLERLADAKVRNSDAHLFLEQKIDLTAFVPEGFGHTDSIVIADHVLDNIDLKFGKGVPVSAKRNKQMMLYSLGALEEFDILYDIHTVRMTIYQPRIDNISVWEISVAELREWGETVLKPKAALAFDGKGEFEPGEHCRFCKIAAKCRANADFNLQIAQHEFKQPDLLTDAEIADILDRSGMVGQWLKAVEEHALFEAVHNGKHWPGYKLVEGRSNRQYADETQVAEKLKQFGEDLIYKKELLGITAMEKAIGKKVFAEHTAGLIIKPPGKPTLVPDSDKRPEYNSIESAQRDFAEFEN